jgi:hypothetical protein
MNRIFVALAGLLILSGVSSFVYAQADAGKTIVPILTLLLDSESSPSSPLPGTLNDTGINWGGDYPSGNNTDCTSNITSLQDCHHGRDATHNNDADGHAGFSFTKLDDSGNVLLASATNWSCVQDNVTGLVWEVKQNRDGNTDGTNIHDADNTYRWGGKTHLGDFGTESEFFSDWDTLVDGANSEVFCGFSNWRVPERKELHSIVDYSSIEPSIDTIYFPNTQSSTNSLYYWSASPNANDSRFAVYVDFRFGSSSVYARARWHYVRLVRGGVVP